MSDNKNVFEAFSSVMAAVQGIGKHERNAKQGYSFRGIDAVMNAVGPALREHGVVVIPGALDMTVERYESKAGGAMKNVTVHMQYTVYGPNGDCFVGSAYGESADSGDKAVPKAQSVAYRTFLLQGLTIPTDERDPDADSHERGMSLADVARDNLLVVCNECGVSPGAAVVEYVKQGNTDDMRYPDNVVAINKVAVAIMKTKLAKP